MKTTFTRCLNPQNWPNISPTLHQNTSETSNKRQKTKTNTTQQTKHKSRQQRQHINTPKHTSIYFIIFHPHCLSPVCLLEEGGCALVGALEPLVVRCGLVVEVVEDLVLRVQLVAHGGGLALEVAEDAVHRAEIRVHLVFACVVGDALNVAALLAVASCVEVGLCSRWLVLNGLRLEGLLVGACLLVVLVSLPEEGAAAAALLHVCQVLLAGLEVIVDLVHPVVDSLQLISLSVQHVQRLAASLLCLCCDPDHATCALQRLVGDLVGLALHLLQGHLRRRLACPRRTTRCSRHGWCVVVMLGVLG
eukprot:m.64205 g.64205  ORF g.64205 m.64205 type:complete len:305 (+) comp13909_c2_seq1:404-1318(+)